MKIFLKLTLTALFSVGLVPSVFAIGDFVVYPCEGSDSGLRIWSADFFCLEGGNPAIFPPDGVYCRALPTKLSSTWPIRSASTSSNALSTKFQS